MIPAIRSPGNEYRESMMSTRTLSRFPPLYPENKPSGNPTTRETETPMIMISREVRVPWRTRLKTSWPMLSVPMMWKLLRYVTLAETKSTATGPGGPPVVVWTRRTRKWKSSRVCRVQGVRDVASKMFVPLSASDVRREVRQGDDQAFPPSQETDTSPNWSGAAGVEFACTRISTRWTESTNSRNPNERRSTTSDAFALSINFPSSSLPIDVFVQFVKDVNE